MPLSEEGRRQIGEKIVAALKDVYDPEIPISVWDLGLIRGMEIDEEGHVMIKMTLTAVGCPIASTIALMTESTVWEKVPEAKSVTVELVWDEPWTPDWVTQEGREQLKQIYGYDVVEEWQKRMQEYQQEPADTGDIH